MELGTDCSSSLRGDEKGNNGEGISGSNDEGNGKSEIKYDGKDVKPYALLPPSFPTEWMIPALSAYENKADHSPEEAEAPMMYTSSCKELSRGDSCGDNSDSGDSCRDNSDSGDSCEDKSDSGDSGDFKKTSGEGELAEILLMNKKIHAPLMEKKSKIASFYKDKAWERNKKLSNTYELVSGATNNFPCVSATHPLSRSFYKFYEIRVDFEHLLFSSFFVEPNGSPVNIQESRRSSSFRPISEPSTPPTHPEEGCSSVGVSSTTFSLSTTASSPNVSYLNALKRNTQYSSSPIKNINSRATSISPMRVAFLSEAPGGFVEAFSYYRCMRMKVPCLNFDDLHGMTLQKNRDNSVPSWNNCHDAKKRSTTTKQIKVGQLGVSLHVHYGVDGTGDLTNIENIDDFIKEVGPNQCNLVTADGGFDFSSDYKKQEIDALPLITCEIYTAINLINKNVKDCSSSCFVMKVFDLSTSSSLGLVRVLHLCFDYVYMCKPFTSRPANSEKYIICMKPRDMACRNMCPYLRNRIFHKNFDFSWVVECDRKKQSPSKKRIRNHHDSLKLFLQSIASFNRTCIEKQICVINKTFDMILQQTTNQVEEEGNEGNSRFLGLSNGHGGDTGFTYNMNQQKQQLSKCKQWCLKYGIPMSPHALNTAFFKIMKIENTTLSDMRMKE